MLLYMYASMCIGVYVNICIDCLYIYVNAYFVKRDDHLTVRQPMATPEVSWTRGSKAVTQRLHLEAPWIG